MEIPATRVTPIAEPHSCKFRQSYPTIGKLRPVTGRANRMVGRYRDTLRYVAPGVVGMRVNLV